MHLHRADLCVDPRLVLVLGLPDAQERLNALRKSLVHLLVDVLLSSPKSSTAFAVPDEYVLGTHTLEHARGDGAGKGSRRLCEAVLCSDLDVGPSCNVGDTRDVRVGDKDCDLEPGAEFRVQGLGLRV
jgi:hypothetical protein